MRLALHDRPPVELSSDPAFRRRVQRLVGVSVVALGAIWLLAHMTLQAVGAVDVALVAGWVAMPTVLALSLVRPRLRYLLALPAGLVGAALVGVCIVALPTGALARAGWLLITAGVLLGAALGVWFWYRWLPAPQRLTDPFSSGRWALIALHAIPVVAGMLLVLLARFT